MQINRDTGIARDARILIVDDEPTNIDVISRILRRAGYAICISMSDSEEALAKFRNLMPDILLLDWHMHPVSGLDFVETLKTRLKPAQMPPVIVLTADDSPETRREALALGVNDFLSKPFDGSEVLLRIRNALHLRQARLEVEAAKEKLEQQVLELRGEVKALQEQILSAD